MKSSPAEVGRLDEANRGIQQWKFWGPYLSERQWGTVREDYSEHGTAWDYFPHDHARSRAYRWGEDGLAGFSDQDARLCLSLALWNGQDPILKERLFGLTNSEGNHGEDVKEIYYYLDATPSHSYLKMLYKYPQRAFPYEALIAENARRKSDLHRPEFELLDTGVFDEDRYWDVFVEYAQASPGDILMEITAHNRGPEPAVLHLLPQLWFRNTWSWKRGTSRPQLRATADGKVQADHAELGPYILSIQQTGRTHRSSLLAPPEWLFCDNETNSRRLQGFHDATGFFKDAFHDCVVSGRTDAVNPARIGTKTTCHLQFRVASSQSVCVKVRLSPQPGSSRLEQTSQQADERNSSSSESSADNSSDGARRTGSSRRALDSFGDFDHVMAQRRREVDEFYADLQQGMEDADARLVQRQALAGMIWSKQFYRYDVAEWLRGDETQPEPPAARRRGRNHEWTHLNNEDIISMPDKWEYPWYAAWDSAFHCVPLALVDAEFAKGQLILLTREWYMHPNGQLPAYEWAFGDVNPPVHAWAAWRVFQMDRKQRRITRPKDPGDLMFLERVFHKLMLNFTWWVNRKDAQGRNVFQGGFLGLDNIGVFDRSATLPTGGFINQADGTAWMAMYSLNLMRIALELARHNPAYQDIATKFFEHFLHIAEALNHVGEGIGLWDPTDEFYYDVLQLPDGGSTALKVRSMVGLIPLSAVEVIDCKILEDVPDFAERLVWFLNYRPDLANLVSRWQEPGKGERRLLSLLRGHRMKCLLRRMLDETEFLSDYGVRALSKVHERNPYRLETGGKIHEVSYWPAESRNGLFGGNSNWRGPIWMPVNYLIIEGLQRFHHYYGNDFKVECPTGSGRFLTLEAIANELARRLSRLFLKDESGQRPVLRNHPKFATDPLFRDHILFYEYFHGESGVGVGASHQTGWTGLVAKLLHPRPGDVIEGETEIYTRMETAAEHAQHRQAHVQPAKAPPAAPMPEKPRRKPHRSGNGSFD